MFLVLISVPSKMQNLKGKFAVSVLANFMNFLRFGQTTSGIKAWVKFFRITLYHIWQRNLGILGNKLLAFGEGCAIFGQGLTEFG